jgi:hypothetical protein
MPVSQGHGGHTDTMVMSTEQAVKTMSKTDDATQKFIDAVIEAVRKREKPIEIQSASATFVLKNNPTDKALLRPGSTNDAGRPIPGCAALELPCTSGTRAPSALYYGTGQTFLTDNQNQNVIDSCADLIVTALCK